MRTKLQIIGAMIGASVLASCMSTTSGSSTQSMLSADADKCSAVNAANLGATTASSRWVAADDAAQLPAYCEVTATLSPVPGSAIGVVYRLPEGWNGKMLGLGGGGWAGNVTLEAATPGLLARYAIAQTDGGHPGTAPFDTEWVSNAVAVEDFSHRAIHEMTKAGKRLVAVYYGRAQDRAYFHGCSTGGRMALMEAQRYPQDYDAIISMAPVYSLQVQTSAVMRNNLFAQPGAAPRAEGLSLAAQGALAACDAKDGVTDGVIADPRACRWDPSSTAGLTSAQQSALRVAYDGVRAPDGSWAQHPMSRGGEADWGVFVAVNGDHNEFSNGGGMNGLLPLLFPGKTVSLKAMMPAQVVEARAGAFAKMYEATDPDLSAFFGRGGKLLMWHGESDPGPSPVATIEYVEAAKRANPAASAQGLRMFLAPGVGHCSGGPGADQVDMLGALDAWMDSGTPPERLIASRTDGPMVRPLCAWPMVAQYGGTGDANDPANYRCIARD